MIDTRNRFPDRTIPAMHAVLHMARQQLLAPVHWRLGFFNLRDVIRDTGPLVARRSTSTRLILGVPYAVCCLDDFIQLNTRPVGHPDAPLIPIHWQDRI